MDRFAKTSGTEPTQSMIALENPLCTLQKMRIEFSISIHHQEVPDLRGQHAVLSEMAYAIVKGPGLTEPIKSWNL